MTNEQVFNKKKAGDYEEVAVLLGLTKDNVRMILKRPNAKKFDIAMDALRKVVEARESVREQFKLVTE